MEGKTLEALNNQFQGKIKWDVVAIGNPKRPLFKATVRLGNRTFEGTGSSKHTAKKIAAGTALIQLPESKMEMEQNFSGATSKRKKGDGRKRREGRKEECKSSP